MWSFSAWRRQRRLRRHLIEPSTWQSAIARAPILQGLTTAELQRLHERASLFLAEKHLSLLGDLELSAEDRAYLAALAQLPLLHLAELDWYRGFHEIILYPDDFLSPQRKRDAAGVEHRGHEAHSGEAWLQGPVILSWRGVSSSGQWGNSNLVIHELSHKLDMLNGSANGQPPLHNYMHADDWAEALKTAYDQLNHTLDRNPQAHTEIDPYAAENPAEFFAVISEYFFNAPETLQKAYPAVYQQLQQFYRQDPASRRQSLH